MAIEELINSGLVPQEGNNMWSIYNAENGAEVHLLGTVHTIDFGNLKNGKQIFDILKGTKYNHIYSELEMNVSGIKIDDDMGRDIEFAHLAQKTKPDKADPDYKARLGSFIAYRKFLAEREPRLRQGIIDEMYIAIASAYSDLEKRTIGLETEEKRQNANDRNLVSLGESMSNIPISQESKDIEAEYVLSGNQKGLFSKMLEDMKNGYDIENVEERNNTWFQEKNIRPGERQLWIVGCKHLAGLITLFSKEGWQVSPMQSLE
ncbi:MAG: TraB/GumN family protein [Clostridium sp.]|nr:TraB/GumN family protein [Clostridium sp.]